MITVRPFSIFLKKKGIGFSIWTYGPRLRNTWKIFPTFNLGTTLWIPNHHEPWPLRRASLDVLDDDLVAAAGLPGLVTREPDSVLHSDGIHTTFGMPRIVRDA